jgi:predicted NACHT family NTPase
LQIDGANLAALIEVQKVWLDQTLRHVSSGLASKSEVRDFFVKCQTLFEKIGNLLDNRLILEAMGIDPTQKFRMAGAERITMPIRDVFNTGINCAVFGEAGAGKSTTLRMYAEQSTLDAADDTVITLFLPLNRVLAGVSKINNFAQINSLKKLEQGLAEYFSSSGKAISIRELVDFLQSKKRVIFVFDGLDEVIKTSPWIIDAINELELTYSNSQIILSSRSSGSYIDKVRYLSLTLLPFSDEQVLSFIRGWFVADEAKAELVENHLCSTSSLMTIVRSPLLATILCVLADNGVPLPNGEIGMYSERMRLLLGHYDIHKKTKRTSSPNIILELVSRKLAFYLHSKSVRSAPHSVLEEAAVKISREQDWGYSADQVKLAVSELVDPCNILVPMTDDGQFGFDHLRYQEFLAANEIIQNRGISLVPLLASPWWRSVFIIFARMTDNIHHIFSEILENNGNISNYRETLAAMASIRNPAEKRVLLGLLDKHSKLDELDQDLKEFYDFDTEFDDVMSYRTRS